MFNNYLGFYFNQLIMKVFYKDLYHSEFDGHLSNLEQHLISHNIPISNLLATVNSIAIFIGPQKMLEENEISSKILEFNYPPNFPEKLKHTAF